MEHGNKATHVVYINCADTLQYSFASYLSMEFRRKGIHAFVNCKGILDMIEGARASVVVFSKNYLSSTSCLDKLAKVLQCWRNNGQLVVPVFYGVSPSDVVPEHKSADWMKKWSSALQELRELSGHQSRERFSECKLVEEIVKDVYRKLFPTENIGIDSKLLEIEHLLSKQTWGVRRIGIWGMPGIGKTTLAKAVFNHISGGYEASRFIKHFDKAFHEKGFHRLMGEHFGNILKEFPRVRNSIMRPNHSRDKFSKKRTLVVLDDVHNPLVAESFLRGFHWFGPGSLIIITSRDKQVLRFCQINHVYEVQNFNEKEALQLFSGCAFGKDIREQNLLELSMEVIKYANGNPLALRFYGRELKGKKLSGMESTFLKLKLRTPYNIHKLFRSSYETLNNNEKNIFLDIACFFNGENVDYVMQLLEGCGFFPHVGIDALVEKCLVTISENRVTMHRIIQDFGREIINGETVQIERRRRLWEPWTIQFLLEDDELVANGDPKQISTRALGSEDIEGIFMDTMNLIFDVKPAAFKNMFNLRFLKIYCSSYEMHCGLRLPKGLESLPYELRLLHWENYPLQSLPRDFNPCHLVELNMPYSQLQKLWAGNKNLEMLKMVRLCHSQQLNEIDDICKAQNIELIDLQGCIKLQSFPAVCQLQHLRVVNLSGCREIKIFPEVSPNIEELHLQGTGIRELPISFVTLSQQAKLNRVLSNLLTEFSGVSDAMNVERLTSLVKINSSNQHLSKLVCLNMKDCSNLRSLPHMVDLESLKVLDMSGCSELEHIQGFPQNLKELYLAGTAIKELPPLPQSLEVLNAHGCVSLKSIPSGFKQLPRYCTFSNCFSLSAEVVSEYLKNALAYVECTAREYQQKQEPNRSLDFSFSVSSPAKEKFTFHLHPGYSVLVRMSPSWRSTLVAFAILVEAAFSDDYLEATALGFKCVCRWKDKEGLSRRLDKTFHCWTPGKGVHKFQKEHMFLFCDLNLHPSTCTGKDPDILADLIVFEIFPVNKHMKLIDESCTVTRCGIYVITSAYGDASYAMSQPVLSLDCPKMLSDDEVEEVLRGLEEKDRFLFLYIACLVNDEEAIFVAPRIASIGAGISSGFKVLADNSLICISTDGVIRYLLETMGREIVRRQCMQPDSLKLKHTPSIHSGELVGIEDHVADMISLSSSKSEEVKTVGIWGPSGKGEAIYSSMVDPKMAAELELVDKEVEKLTKARTKVLDELRAKRAERSELFDLLDPLKSERKGFNTMFDEKRKEMEPLQQALGKLRNNDGGSARGPAICSSEDELNSMIYSYQYRIQHESIPLTEEKQLLKEIRLLEGTRDKVIGNAAMRAKIKESMGQKDDIQGQVKLMGAGLDGVKKERQAISARISEKLKATKDEIQVLENELKNVSEKRDKAYSNVHELRKQRDEANPVYYQNRTMLNKARDLAAQKNISELETLSNAEVEKSISLWCSKKNFREDYEKRNLTSLDSRQLSRDGRMRNPEEKPLIAPEARPSKATPSETEVVPKAKAKPQPKEEPVSAPKPDSSVAQKTEKAKDAVKVKSVVDDDDDEVYGLGKPQKEEKKVVDEATAKEMRKQVEIAKAKQAMDRKKKLAERAAAKAAIRAQKEAEKKEKKEQEKKAKKKAGGNTETEAEEVPEASYAEKEETEAPVQEEKPIRNRIRSRGPKTLLPREILKRKKSTNYWVYAAPAALVVLMLLVLGYNYVL